MNHLQAFYDLLIQPILCVILISRKPASIRMGASNYVENRQDVRNK